MRNEGLRYLVKEYRRAEKKLYEITTDHTRLKTAHDIVRGLDRDLSGELEKAQDNQDQAQVEFWQGIIDGFFHNDPDKPQKSLEDVEKEIAEKEKYITYYTRKIKVITQLLGTRRIELLEGFEEKSILMGSEHSSGSAMEMVQEAEEAEFQIRKAKRDKVEFDKM